MQRLSLVKLEIVSSIVLLVVCIGHFGWCEWSIPRYGEMGPHGIQTASCNLGTLFGRIVFGVTAVLTLLSGVLGYRARAKRFAWYAAQTPAIVSWAWIGYGLLLAIIHD